MSRHNDVLHAHLAKKKRLNWFDRIVILAAFVYPMTGIPQIISVYTGHTDGVSVASWAGFMLFSALFLTYGIKHRIKPMMISNSLWLCTYVLVVFGLLFHVQITPN